ncbi:MAG TPA: outer membrane lipoprotein-sorting protein [Verrucomicrobiae bacterium]|jgi:hypothetical protein|nr:outer membrane lipoprotein-sorting protein [Verrucomicrobiae bacterium]
MRLSARFFCALLVTAAVRCFADDAADGRALVAQLCAAVPDENAELRATVQIRSSAVHADVPLRCNIAVAANSWSATYLVSNDCLTVTHVTNGPNQYSVSFNHGPTNSILPSAAEVPLAGSDFTLADLGLDFLHWPTQRQLPGDMRLGQPCYVLESSRPAGGVVRIRSYIDKQSGGIIVAEGCDAAGKLVKKFSLHGSSFRRVHGQWRLEKMEMTDKRKGSQTTIVFDTTNHQ